MKFLHIKDRTHYPINKASEFINIKKYVEDDLSIVKSFYSDGAFFVNNKNILVRLIKQIHSGVFSTIDAYIDLISIDFKYKAKTIGFVSELSKGRIFKSVFGDTVTFIEDEFMSPYDAYNNLDLPVMKVLYTDYTDLSMNHPSKIKKGNFIISVDIIAMMAQYYKYNELNNYDVSNAQHFVYKILYTNIISDLFDWSILNRFNNPLAEPSTSKHVFSVRKYDNSITKMNNNIRERVYGTNKYYSETLEHIPSIDHNNMYDKVFLSNFHPNAQSYWVYFIIVSSIFIPIVHVLSEQGFRKNMSSVVDFKWFFKIVESNKYLHRDFKTQEFSHIVNTLYDEAKLITERKDIS
jgi:hypothetical protein